MAIFISIKYHLGTQLVFMELMGLSIFKVTSSSRRRVSESLSKVVILGHKISSWVNVSLSLLKQVQTPLFLYLSFCFLMLSAFLTSVYPSSVCVSAPFGIERCAHGDDGGLQPNLI